MTKKILLAVASTLFAQFFIMAQSNKISLQTSTENEINLSFSLQNYQFETVTTPKGEAQLIHGEALSPILLEGMPDLPKFTTSVIIPATSLMQVEITESKYTEINNVNIAPSKGNLLRTVNPADVPYTYGRPYDKDEFFPQNIASLQEPFVVRDYRGQTVQLFPFQYNPVTKVLRVYSEVKIKISSIGEDDRNILTNTRSVQKVNSEFQKIYSSLFINYSNRSERYTALPEEGSMLIICNDAWMSLLQPLVLWKNTIGRPTTLVSKTTAGGTAANIKTYVTNFYNNNDLAYLLLVGDAAQIPTNSGSGLGGDSDNAYAYVTGNDHYQEFFVGRFSAETADHVSTQVLRTIEYEKGDQLANGWLNKVISVASSEGAGIGDDGEIDYQHLRNIQTDLINFTYINPVFELFDGSQGSFDASGNPSAANVSTAVNTGAGIINYVGHGSDTYWVTSGFSATNALALQNYNKLPFIFDVACVNGNFVSQTCFAEGWMRSQNNGEPTGAIAINASTINQSWAPPMVAQDEMNDILTEIATSGIKRTYGGIIVNGYFKMNEETSDFAMTDTWTCFGDPSLYVRTDNPASLAVTHSNVLIVGNTTFDVNCNFNTALATLSLNGVIIGSAVVNGGVAHIPVANVTPGQVLTLAVVGFNYVTYLADVTVISPSGSYLIVQNYVNTINYSETKNIDLNIKNVGTSVSENASAQMSITTTDATLSNATYNFGAINADAISVMSTGAFTLTAANNLTDQSILPVQIQMTDNSGETFTEIKNITVNAPAFNILGLSISDATGNNDGILDPGENGLLIITVTNNGHAAVENVIGHIVSANPNLVFAQDTTMPISMGIGETMTFVFQVSAASSISLGTMVNLTFNLTGGVSNQYSGQKNYQIVIGFIPSYCAAGADTTTDEFISSVVFGTVNNTSGSSSYTDYSTMYTNVNVGQSIPITIVNGEHWSGDKIGCWVDWNYDGDFNDTNETITVNYTGSGSSGAGTGTGTATITVPANAHVGLNRVRVRVMYSGTLSSCGNASYGEVEDYSINVQQLIGVDNILENQVLLYPNPNDGTFSIELKEWNQSAYIEVLNTQGQIVYKNSLNDVLTHHQINQATGVYFVKVKVGNQSAVKKLIIQ